MSPFGAMETVQRSDHSFDHEDTQSLDGPQIRFAPGHQNLHGAFSFTATIEDPEGVPDDYHIRILYNNYDVTDRFLSRAKRTFLDLTGRRLQLTFSHLRLPPNKDHKIKLVYYRGSGARPTVAEFRRPTCPVFKLERDVASVPGFQPPTEVLDLINFHATKQKINPNLIAGLIAEESGFDPLAVSNKKAMGLTQITSLGEAEILKTNADFPRYPGLADMSYPFLKIAVLNRQIHAGNEWRLDPSLSIKGGVDYVSRLADYWSRPRRRISCSGSRTIPMTHSPMCCWRATTPAPSASRKRSSARTATGSKMKRFPAPLLTFVGLKVFATNLPIKGIDVCANGLKFCGSCPPVSS